MRQTGRTTQQMKEAPKGAVFVWNNNHLHYAHGLAHKLGREDLRIVSPSWLHQGHYRGLDVDVVLDHACKLDMDTMVELQKYLLTRKPTK